MEPLFTEIIFPSKPKPASIIADGEDYRIEHWIGGEPPYKALYVQCPVCFYPFRLATVLDEETLEAYMKEFPLIYFNSAIRDCPDKANHWKEPWHKHSPK